MFDAEILTKINAEAYLGILYPELASQWTVYDKGLFYRNYSRDILALDVENASLTLSRDGWLMYLPPEMLSPEDEMAVGKSVNHSRRVDFASLDKVIRQRLALLHEAFVPFDSFRFRAGVRIEKVTQEILSSKVNYILKKYFGFDMDAEKNEYVRKAAVLLPYIGRLRGNLRFVKSLIQSLTGHEVAMSFSNYGEEDHTQSSIRKVFFDININDLTPETYERERMDIQPLADFIIERFIPFEMLCDIRISGENPGMSLLDYNYWI